jgi:molybdopterin molybdotransferase
MKEFFKVVQLADALALRTMFKPINTETIPIYDSLERIIAQQVTPDVDIPGFMRSTMDGYALNAASTFGASESNPAFLTITGTIDMGEEPRFSITLGQAARIATGGMLPSGADSVVMLEHTDTVTNDAIEVFKSVAPGQHVIEKGEDLMQGKVALTPGRRIRPQELGLLAACGLEQVEVYKKPKVGIISTGDEVISIDQRPAVGQIRDMNSYTLAGLVVKSGGIPINYGIVKDDFTALNEKCMAALATSDMVLISGGSSVGVRDLSIKVLENLPDSQIWVHGISISPGKPTILAQSGTKAIWGLPGHVASSMVVFRVVVRPFLEHLSGFSCHGTSEEPFVTARLTRNLASVQGRVDFVRVRLRKKNQQLWAEPVLGKSGLIRTMVDADGLIAIDLNLEGVEEGAQVRVHLI